MTDASGVGVGGLRDLRRTYLGRRYAILFYTLLFTMVVAPVSAALKLSGAVIDLLQAANLFAAVMPVDAARSRRLVLALMTIVWLARPATAWLKNPVFSLMTLGIWALIGLFAAAAALRFTLGARKVESEHVYAALSAYLLAGIFFGVSYWVLERIRPGMFTTAGDFSRTGAIYFSFVTLATLGYGDIVPRADVARGLVIVEAVGGQLFLAVLVARLVSSYSSRAEE